MTLELPHLSTQGFEGVFSLEFTEVGEERASGRVLVRDEHKQPAGVVHGGVYAAIAESLACRGTGIAVANDGKLAIGLSNQTSVLRPIAEGTINAHAARKHRGRTTWVWEVGMHDDQGRLCVLSRVTIAVREAPQSTA